MQPVLLVGRDWNKMTKDSFDLFKKNLSYWWPIIGVVVSFILGYSRLQSKVEAMYDKGANLRTDYEESIVRIDDSLQKIVENQQQNCIAIAEIKRDIEYIKQQVK